jgi:hypothetical protein
VNCQSKHFTRLVIMNMKEIKLEIDEDEHNGRDIKGGW